MLEQILTTMHIDAELLAELDDEQKHVLFFKMREEQVRRWKKWEAELGEDHKKISFVPSKPHRAANLKVSFATGLDGKPNVTVMDDVVIDDVRKRNDGDDEATKNVAISEVCNTTSAHRSESQTSQASSEVLKSTTAKNISVQKPLAEKKENVGSSVENCKPDELSALNSKNSNDQNEVDWQNSLKKSKDYDEMRRVIARMVRLSLTEIPQSSSLSLSSNNNSGNNNTATQSQLDARNIIPPSNAVKPQPAARPAWMKSSKPTCRGDIIEWFQNVEEKKRTGLEPGGHVVSPWFHGVITREEAENYVRDQRMGSFIVRVSERVWGYVVTYLGSRTDHIHGQIVPQVKHCLVDAGTRGYRLFGANRLTHSSLSDLVKHHEKNPISLTGNEMLLFPIGQNRDLPDYSDLFFHYSQTDERSRSVRRTAAVASTSSFMQKNLNDLRLQLFTSSSSTSDRAAEDIPAKAFIETVQTTMNKVQIDHDVEIGLRSLQRDLHEQRLKKLRELLKVISHDDWMYQSAEKLVGLK